MEKTIYERAIEKFGSLSQQDKLIEEMSELTKVILKNRRKWNDIDITHNLHEEWVDVMILMEQIKYDMLDDSHLKEVWDERHKNLLKLISDPNYQPNYPLFG